MLQFTLFYFPKQREITVGIHDYRKNKVFSDLIVPFTACPFEKVEVDCPFVDYWKVEGLEQVMELIDKLPEQQLLEYREQH
jgi:hypothetical protein